MPSPLCIHHLGFTFFLFVNITAAARACNFCSSLLFRALFFLFCASSFFSCPLPRLCPPPPINVPSEPSQPPPPEAFRTPPGLSHYVYMVTVTKTISPGTSRGHRSSIPPSCWGGVPQHVGLSAIGRRWRPALTRGLGSAARPTYTQQHTLYDLHYNPSLMLQWRKTKLIFSSECLLRMNSFNPQNL